MMRNNIKTIARSEIDENNLYGFVIDKNDHLTLVMVEDDFWLDGYQILRNSDITSLKLTDTNRHCMNILRKEGLLRNISNPAIDIDAWPSVFRSLKKHDKFVIVEDEIEEDFLIGPIARVNKNTVSIKCFDGTGRWEGVQNIRYEDITTVRFDCRYILYHQKYTEEDNKV